MMPINHHLDPLERSGIRVFTNLAKATPDCRMLTIGEPDQATPEPIRQAALEALSRGEPTMPQTRARPLCAPPLPPLKRTGEDPLPRKRYW